MTPPRTLVVAGAALAALAAPQPGRPWLVWNATASAPTGLWRIGPLRAPATGDWVVARPAGDQAGWLAARGYLPSGVLLLKRVAALEGQRVCRRGGRLTIDGRLAARARMADHQARPLRAWTGCRLLGPGEVLLLNPPPDSVDGRYLGPTSRAAIVGRATPVWTTPS